MTKRKYVVPFDRLRMSDVEQVGGKNASLGEMISQLSTKGIRVPNGFATTAEAYRELLAQGGLDQRIEAVADSSGGSKNDYFVTFTVKPCAQKFVKLQDVFLPQLGGLPITPVATNAGVVVVLYDSGVQCMGPTKQETVLSGYIKRHPGSRTA